jgi:hypothetical protein
LPTDSIVVIDRQYVGDVDQLDVSFFARRLVFAGDVFGECEFRGLSFMRKATCGDLASTVEDDPD